MNIGQFSRATTIRERIRELKIMRNGIERNEYKIKIDGYEIPKNSREVILALCLKEMDELEKEFENL